MAIPAKVEALVSLTVIQFLRSRNQCGLTSFNATSPAGDVATKQRPLQPYELEVDWMSYEPLKRGS